MHYPNFCHLQKIYNSQIDKILSCHGLTTKCEINYGITNSLLCPNCIYDAGLKKSSNKYKTNGPIPFPPGQLCPYCHGVGKSGKEDKEIIYMAVLADNKNWINKPMNVAIHDNMIQTICNRSHYFKLKKCKDLTIIYHPNGDNPKYSLYNDPTPAGLGDNNYIIAIWKDA
jgi:hypothetical protein